MMLRQCVGLQVQAVSIDLMNMMTILNDEILLVNGIPGQKPAKMFAYKYKCNTCIESMAFKLKNFEYFFKLLFLDRNIRFQAFYLL